MIITETSRLIFSTWSSDDIDDALLLWGDSNVMTLLDSRGSLTRKHVEEKIEYEIDCQLKQSIQYWKLNDKVSGIFIGCCGLRRFDNEADILELGVHIVQLEWGSGYATEATKAVIKYAFEKLNPQKLVAGHNPANLKSKGLLKKLGLTYVRKLFYQPTGMYHPCYELLAPNEND